MNEEARGLVGDDQVLVDEEQIDHRGHGAKEHRPTRAASLEEVRCRLLLLGALAAARIGCACTVPGF
jgi:hypothetical protein